MKLIKREGVYYADLRDAGGGRVSLGTTDRAIATTRMREEFDKLSQAKLEKAQQLSLIGLFRRCMHETDWHSHKDQDGIYARWKTVSEYFGADRSVASIDEDLLSQFVGHRRGQGVKDQTIYKDLMLLSPMLKAAKRWKYITAVPEMPKVKSQSNTRMWIYTVEQERQIIDWLYTAGYERVAELVGFLVDSGWRISEALSTFSVMHGRAILWDQKGGSQSGTPLTPRALKAAQRRLWKGMEYDEVQDVWEKLRAALGYPLDANLHAWRHTCATRLAQAGVQVKAIQGFMRHESLNTTMKYVKLVSSDLDGCVAALSQHCATSVPNGVPSTVPQNGTKLVSPNK